MDKKPVFDAFGNQLGWFTPVGGFGCLGYLLLALLALFIYPQAGLAMFSAALPLLSLFLFLTGLLGGGKKFFAFGCMTGVLWIILSCVFYFVWGRPLLEIF